MSQQVTIRPSKYFKPFYENYLNDSVRYFLAEGGRAGGRSFEASVFTLFCMQNLPYFRGVCLRLIHKELSKSCYKDLTDRIKEQGLEDIYRVLKSPLQISLGDKVLDFQGFKTSSSSQTAKNKSLAGYNFIWIEEADEIDEEDFNQLVESLRKANTRIIILLTFNPPPKGHWILKRWFKLLPAPELPEPGFFKPVLSSSAKNNTIHVHTTYKQNIKNINPNTVLDFEMTKERDPRRYYHMIAGYVPSRRTGLVFNDYNIIPDKEYFDLDLSENLGLDFGWNHPSTLQGVKTTEKNIYINEYFYQNNLTLGKIAGIIKDFGFINKEIIGDNQAAADIQTLNKEYGTFITPSKKGRGSVINGINKIKNKKIFITESSKGLITEAQNYSYKKSKTKEILEDELEDDFNHGWDAVRYAIENQTESTDLKNSLDILSRFT